MMHRAVWWQPSSDSEEPGSSLDEDEEEPLDDAELPLGEEDELLADDESLDEELLESSGHSSEEVVIETSPSHPVSCARAPSQSIPTPNPDA